MKRHQRLQELFARDEQQRRCTVAETSADHHALRRRFRAGEVIQPYRGMYARVEYWHSLDPLQHVSHVMQTLARKYHHWVFAGSSAAVAHGYEVSFASVMPLNITIASDVCPTKHDYTKLNRIYMPSIPACTRQGVSATSPARTLLDCALKLPFHQALPIFDSAMRENVNLQEVGALGEQLRLDCSPVASLIAYADGRSENGGESLVRAIMISEGYVVPRLQREFKNPDQPFGMYRVDFSWQMPDGGIIVAEFDGMQKYVMDDGRDVERKDIRQRVYDERDRERCLRSQGVRQIIRLDYEDTQEPKRLARKLHDAGVPRRVQ